MQIVVIIIIIIKTTFGLTCMEILELPDNNQLSIYELRTIQPKEVVQCLFHLGREKLAFAEAEFIWNSIIQFHNGIENIPQDVLVILHYVTIAVQPDDYVNITLESFDVISNFGFYYGLNDEQLEAIAEKVHEDFGAKRLEDYTFYDLTALRQILCAFNRSEIERINPKAYKEAAVSIGKLKKCNYEILQGFANLATKEGAFGSPDLWTNATIRAMGAVVEYLPEEILCILKVKLRVGAILALPLMCR